MKLEEASNIALEWFTSNMMQANADKFQCILISRTEVEKFELQLKDTTITAERDVKLLGIFIDSKLNFEKHVSTICKKSSNQVKAMFRLPRVLSVECKMNMYRSFIASNFMYCSLIWHLCGKTSTRKVEGI